MDLFETSNDWAKKLEPILTKYKGRKHPLDYHNLYQLLVMVVLSAQDSDAHINKIAPALFEVYPNMKSLSVSNVDALIPYISNVRNFGTKANWLLEIAQTIKKDENIPLTMEDLVALKGIGRKSANVIMREAKVPAKGIIADLHVIRVAPRIGLITEAKDGIKAEKQLMQVLPREIWGEIGMAISFLGREICRPTPQCPECPINAVCEYYKKLLKEGLDL
ncbi:endonuclease III domain-containing protein [Flavobacterium gawalongense]|uniref:Endonuclease III n=1 Tax=Flavobacterium gawalongense TaxID=2594432 RepID=A0A553BFE1_9FLAO|nr:endonuclease III [Flavobacterium gawalongense]TRW99844.1 endonuclease III [Flavobacterium gawalongense]TRX04314.1 endonuclease III [Flavobacterium gawalongense]TRX06966.1 endonuclease III [Flavobacterium gawalongense]TRX07904.1 endonuclease III [Flavobacterium gawalongense]TRX24152.1 endonuclease III [Flavobacterium gawalongense]